MPLSAIGKAFTKLPNGRTPSRDDWGLMSAEWSKDLDERIVQLQKLRDGLSDCIGCGCLSIEGCALVNWDGKLGKDGPGPRRLVADVN